MTHVCFRTRALSKGSIQIACLVGVVLISGLIGSRDILAQDNAEHEVVATVDAFHEALAAGDSVSALGYLSNDVTILESGGVENKAHYRSGHLAGDIRFASAVPRERGEIIVSIVGDVAWTRSTSITKGSMGEREINSQGAELVVLAREHGVWKIKAIHWSSRQLK